MDGFLDPVTVRRRMSDAGLFLVGHELLRHAIASHPLSFFAKSWTAAGPATGDDYRREILALDPKGRRDAFRGSLSWLLANAVIDPEDAETIRRATGIRNTLAHQLADIVGGAVEVDFGRELSAMTDVTTEIERWWIMNVELACDPDRAGAVIEKEEVTPGSLLMMRILTDVLNDEGDGA